VIIERDESDASVFLESVHESITIFVFAVFFPFKSLIIDEAIVEIVLVFAIICFVFIFNTEVMTSAAAKVARNRFIIGIIIAASFKVNIFTCCKDEITESMDMYAYLVMVLFYPFCSSADLTATTASNQSYALRLCQLFKQDE
jgi:hypothetical protein